jgi:probable phosphoglycerate mutase
VSTFLLIRHGETDFVGKRLAGRMPGVHLNTAGRAQVARLAEALTSSGIEAVYSGPLERAQESAAPLCERLGLACQIADEFNEIDFGDWTNCTFAELESQPLWQRFNSDRGKTAPPNGELMLEVQARALRKLEELRSVHQTVAIVSHCDVIRSVVVHALGMPIDLLLRVDIDPASVSVIELNDWGSRVRLINAQVNSDGRLLIPEPRD